MVGRATRALATLRGRRTSPACPLPSVAANTAPRLWPVAAFPHRCSSVLPGASPLLVSLLLSLIRSLVIGFRAQIIQDRSSPESQLLTSAKTAF